MALEIIITRHMKEATEQVQMDKTAFTTPKQL